MLNKMSLTKGVISVLDQPDVETRLTILQVLHVVPCTNKPNKPSRGRNWKLLLTDGDSVCYAYITYPCNWLVSNGIIRKYSVVSFDTYNLDSMVPVMSYEKIPYLHVKRMHLKYQLDKAESSANYIANWVEKTLTKRDGKQQKF